MRLQLSLLDRMDKAIGLPNRTDSLDLLFTSIWSTAKHQKLALVCTS